MKTRKYLLIINFLIFCILVFGASYILRNSIIGTTTSKTVVDNNQKNIVISDDYKITYLNMIKDGINSIWNDSEILIDEENIITVEISDNLTDKEIMYIMAMMDAYDDEYWTYEENEDLIEVILIFGNGRKEFSISKNKKTTEFNI